MAAPYNAIWCQLKHGSHLALEMIVGGQRFTGEQIALKVRPTPELRHAGHDAQSPGTLP